MKRCSGGRMVRSRPGSPVPCGRRPSTSMRLPKNARYELHQNIRILEPDVSLLLLESTPWDVLILLCFGFVMDCSGGWIMCCAHEKHQPGSPAGFTFPQAFIIPFLEKAFSSSSRTKPCNTLHATGNAYHFHSSEQLCTTPTVKQATSQIQGHLMKTTDLPREIQSSSHAIRELIMLLHDEETRSAISVSDCHPYLPRRVNNQSL